MGFKGGHMPLVPPASTTYALCLMVEGPILRHLHANGYPTLDMFKDSESNKFCALLDTEMRRL